jgi:hypothetical protein
VSDVEDWFAAYDNPMKPVMLRVRQIILEDERMSETIKGKTRTFVFGGNMASFNPRAKQHVSLLFHTGASIPGSTPAADGRRGHRQGHVLRRPR